MKFLARQHFPTRHAQIPRQNLLRIRNLQRLTFFSSDIYSAHCGCSLLGFKEIASVISRNLLHGPFFKGPSSRNFLQGTFFKETSSWNLLQGTFFKGPSSRDLLQGTFFKGPSSRDLLQGTFFKEPSSWNILRETFFK